ncbi:hypothetical protein PAXRUDRAFT_823924 [Paxillus rubicundulus Ve08.2h10]|uniref:Uncharacterized protein n=1 Tax=Paxillus rubicundulus Ve08.2h10 TaxID=930991 RepID=A0A0D0E8C2_9AGAM|nr:hypothetical protein PAXRUDRAFT_823924 [Paxillus rubicundulus Ve08.2h10]
MLLRIVRDIKKSPYNSQAPSGDLWRSAGSSLHHRASSSVEDAQKPFTDNDMFLELEEAMSIMDFYLDLSCSPR